MSVTSRSLVAHSRLVPDLMSSPNAKSVSTLTLTLSGLIVLLLLSGCPNPGAGGSSTLTGEITGHARFIGQSDDSGILISADSVDSSGKTLAVKQAIATRSALSNRSSAGRATTDASGSYTLTGLAAGTYTIYASSQNSMEKAVTTGVTVVAGKNITAADLNLTPTGSIAGRATLNGATSGNLGIMVFIAGTSYSAMTDDKGAFTISSVPATTGYTLVASMQGYNSVTTSVDVTAGAIASVATMNLTTNVAPPTTGTVSGTATLNGVTSGNAGIMVYLAGTSHITMTTSSSGAFTITGVGPGTYTLVASMVGYTSASVSSVTVTAGNTTNVDTLSLPAISAPGGPFFAWYDGNGAAGGSVPVDLTNYLQGFRVTVLGNSGNLVKGGYIFTGWNTQAGGGGTSYIQGQTFTMGSSDVTLYVQWTPVPVVLASGLYIPLDVAVDSTSVYWTEYGNVKKVALGGGTVTTLASGGDPGFIAVDSISVYWTEYDGGTVKKVALGGGTVTTLASGLSHPVHIAVDSTSVYWTENVGSGAVKKVALGGGTVTTLASGGYPSSIAVDSISVYWIDIGGEGAVKKVALGGGTVTTLASGGYPGSIAVDSISVYWTEYVGSGAVKKVALGGGTVTTVASGLDLPYGIAVDSTSVYWTELGGSGAVKKVAIGGGTVTTLASGGWPVHIAVDSTSVYWLGRGTVEKIVKWFTRY